MSTPMTEQTLPEPELIHIPSTIDGVQQPCHVWRATGDKPRPVVVSLHTWGGAYDQKSYSFVADGLARNWHCIKPHFRGPNNQPEACGSPKARQDILDAVDWARANLNVDVDRIYIVGGSGGGHMTLRMIAEAPDVFAAASAWCPIADISQWYHEHVKDGVEGNYARMIAACLGGKPGSSERVDADAKDRSPRYHLQQAAGRPLDISHGVLDGKTGSVPFWHSIQAFNVIAEATGSPVVTQQEIDELWNEGKLRNPQPQDTQGDPLYGDRDIYLRRWAGACRLTIFHGGHEALAAPACAWLAQYSRTGKVTDEAELAPPTKAGKADQIAG